MASDKTLTGLKAAIAVLLLAIVGLGVWMYTSNKSNTEERAVLMHDKENLTANLESLQSDYATLKTDNDSINAALDTERKKIETLLEKVRKDNAISARKIRDYEKELGTLRAIMKSYIVQIDSLNTMNQKLVAENVEMKEKVQQTTVKYEEVSQKAEELTTKVKAGSAVKARGISAVAITEKGKDTEKARKAVKMKTCLTLVANEIADKGAKNVFVRIKDPDGVVLATAANNMFDADGEQLVYSAAREVDYQGSEVDVCVFYDFGGKKIAGKGIYNISVYIDNKLAGTTQVTLR